MMQTSNPAPPRSGRVRLSDIAAAVGVSEMTVSRVLHGAAGVSEATRRKVRDALEASAYTPNTAARSLVTQHTNTIGVLIGGGHGSDALLSAFMAAASRRGRALVLGAASDDEQGSFDAAMSHLLTECVEAICVIAPRPAWSRTIDHGAAPVPVLALSAGSRAGARAAVEHLLGLGHEHILHLGGPLEEADAIERERGWRDALTARSLPLLPTVVGDWSADSGYACGRWHPAIDEVTAVFAADDRMALGLLHGLADRGLRVPDDISVVGYGDLPAARHLSPPLTTVRLAPAAVAEEGIAQLIARIGGRELSAAPPEETLIVRDSTATPRISAG